MATETFNEIKEITSKVLKKFNCSEDLLDDLIKINLDTINKC